MKETGIKNHMFNLMKTALGFFGVEAHFAYKNDKTDRILFDRNTLSHFFQRDKRMSLYREAIKKANVEWTNNFAKELRYYSLQQIAEYAVKKLPRGDFAECGCWSGHSAYIIGDILRANKFKNEFHIFDAFDEQGLPDKLPADKNERFKLTEKEIKQERATYFCSEEQARNTLREFSFVRICKGWIPEPFKFVENRIFSFLHLDVDLYKPTIDSLMFFYPRLLKGGYIVVNDYGITQFPGAKKAVDEFLSRNSCDFFYQVPSGSSFIVK